MNNAAPESAADAIAADAAAADAGFTLQTLDSVELQLPLAGLAARSYAYFLDWQLRVLMILVLSIGYVALVSLTQGQAALRQTPPVLLDVLPLLLYFLYHPVLEVLMRGRTPGKRWAGLRIVSQNGGVPTTGALLTRNVFRLLDCLPGTYSVGLVTMLATRKQQRLGDLASRTVVIHDLRARNTSVERLLGNEALAPALALLIDECLQRWFTLDAAPRRELARDLLQRAGWSAAEIVARNDQGLREALRAALQGPAVSPA